MLANDSDIENTDSSHLFRYLNQMCQVNNYGVNSMQILSARNNIIVDFFKRPLIKEPVVLAHSLPVSLCSNDAMMHYYYNQNIRVRTIIAVMNIYVSNTTAIKSTSFPKWIYCQ